MEPILSKQQIADLLSAIRSGKVPLDLDDDDRSEKFLDCEPVDLFQISHQKKKIMFVFLTLISSSIIFAEIIPFRSPISFRERSTLPAPLWRTANIRSIWQNGKIPDPLEC